MFDPKRRATSGREATLGARRPSESARGNDLYLHKRPIFPVLDSRVWGFPSTYRSVLISTKYDLHVRDC